MVLIDNEVNSTLKIIFLLILIQQYQRKTSKPNAQKMAVRYSTLSTEAFFLLLHN